MEIIAIASFQQATKRGDVLILISVSGKKLSFNRLYNKGLQLANRKLLEYPLNCNKGIENE